MVTENTGVSDREPLSLVSLKGGRSRVDSGRATARKVAFGQGHDHSYHTFLSPISCQCFPLFTLKLKPVYGSLPVYIAYCPRQKAG